MEYKLKHELMINLIDNVFPHISNYQIYLQLSHQPNKTLITRSKTDLSNKSSVQV